MFPRSLRPTSRSISSHRKGLRSIDCSVIRRDTRDPDFDYSGDFECRLSSIPNRDTYSTLFTEDAHQSRDWESRGRFFAASIRGACARIPEFGTHRTFRLRGMRVGLQIVDPVFDKAGGLASLKLAVTVTRDPHAQRPVAESVPLPKTGASDECKLRQYFVDPAQVSQAN